MIERRSVIALLGLLGLGFVSPAMSASIRANFFLSQGLGGAADVNLGYDSTVSPFAIPTGAQSTLTLTGLTPVAGSVGKLVVSLAADLDQIPSGGLTTGENLAVAVEGIDLGIITNADISDDRFDGGSAVTGNSGFISPPTVAAGTDIHPFSSASSNLQQFTALLTPSETAILLADNQLDVQLTLATTSTTDRVWSRSRLS